PHEVLPERVDLLVVPGGGWSDGSPAGARAEVAAGALPAAIAARHAAGATVASVCTGAMIVAAAGLLAGRPGVTHHTAHRDLAAAGAELRPDFARRRRRRPPHRRRDHRRHRPRALARGARARP